MGKLKRTDSGLLVDSSLDTPSKLPPTHWVTWTDSEGGELFNGTQGQCIGVLVGFLQRRGMNKGFQCGMGPREETQGATETPQ